MAKLETKLFEALLEDLLKDERLVLVRKALGVDAELCLVGGTVRDLFLGRVPEDLDLATSLTPEEVTRRLEEAGIRAIPTGLKHQTVSALPVPNRDVVEITTFRSAGMNPQGGLTLGSSIEEDLAYRDFTINALALPLTTGKLVDSFQGLNDLEHRIIRSVGSPEARFAEDPLRLVRAVRFASTFGFAIEPATFGAIFKAAPLLAEVSIERVREEFVKILLSPDPRRGIQLLSETGLLRTFLPEVAAFVGFEQNRFHKADLFEHTLEVIESCEPDQVLRLAALLHDVSKPETLTVDENGERHFFKHESVGADRTEEILSRLRFSNQIIQDVATLVRTHMRPLRAGPPGIRRLLRDTAELFPAWRKLKEADAFACKVDAELLREEFEEFDRDVEIVKAGPPVSPLASLAIRGGDLLELGYQEGPIIGETLRALHELVLDDPELNDRQKLLELAGQRKKNISAE